MMKYQLPGKHTMDNEKPVSANMTFCQTIEEYVPVSKCCLLCKNCKSSRAKHKRRYIPKDIRRKVLERDGYKCLRCGKTHLETTLSLDHIRPVYYGGIPTLNNLRTLCMPCHALVEMEKDYYTHGYMRLSFAISDRLLYKTFVSRIDLSYT